MQGDTEKKSPRAGDRPLVAHAITTSKESHIVDKTILTTDNKEIAQIGRQYGVDQVVKRPEELRVTRLHLPQSSNTRSDAWMVILNMFYAFSPPPR
ncbi:cytidylyltransferase domain-containing protein [Halosimplex aquaticum]